MTAGIVIAKIALDGSAAIGFAISRNWPCALMFLGFAIADVGALWLA